MKNPCRSLKKLANCLLGNINLCRKLVSLPSIVFDDNLKVVPVWFFVAKFNTFSSNSDNFIFHIYTVTMSHCRVISY